MAEVELKFEMPPGSEKAFGRLPALSASRPTRRQLFAMYFDTPGGDLAQREMALRLRRSGGRWTQCLKSGRSGGGGLHSREEWELARPGPSIDLSLFAKTPLAGLPHANKLHRKLEEIFRVEVTRTTWIVETAPGSRVEVALDQGRVLHGNAAEKISEVEVESVAGPPLAVFDFAERIVDAVPLRPSAITKAQRGYRMLRGEKPAPVKAREPALDAAMSPERAARATVAAALEQLQANEVGVLASEEPEYVHQARVALRRMRSALRAFRATSAGELEAQGPADLRWITRITGNARDLDVFATFTLPALLRAYGDTKPARGLETRLAARRHAAREAVREAMGSARYARLLLAIARWLAQPQPRAQAKEKLSGFAARVVRKRHRELIEDAKGLECMQPAERHRVRIRAKRLRYVVEGFAALFRRKPLAAYVAALSDLQDDLGRANDAAVAERLLEELGAPQPLADFARGWLAAERQASLAGLQRHLERVENAKRFWEKR